MNDNKKMLTEAITVDPLAKKQKTGGEKGSSSKLVATPPLMSVPPSPSMPKAVNVKSILFHGLGETITISSDDFIPSTQPLPTSPTDVPSQEELDILLEHFPTFTEMKLPVFYMNELFSIIERILIDVNIDLSYSFMARVLHGTIDATIEAIMRLEDYITIRMIEVV